MKVGAEIAACVQWLTVLFALWPNPVKSAGPPRPVHPRYSRLRACARSIESLDTNEK
jgi:hypothetical protein